MDGILDNWLQVLWAGNWGEQPTETKRVQPVLQAVLSLICNRLSRGYNDDLSVVVMNSTKFALPETVGSVFPMCNFVGSTDLGVKRGGGYVAFVEVKVVFNQKKYLAQAVAQAFGGAAGLAGDQWKLGALFDDSTGRPVGPMPPVLLWNGPLLATVRVDSMRQCTTDQEPGLATEALYALLVKLRDDDGGVAFPKAPRKQHKNDGADGDGGQGDGDRDDIAGGDGDDGSGGAGGSENQNPGLKRKLFDENDRNGNVGTAKHSKRGVVKMKSARVRLMPLTESNLAGWEAAGFRDTYLTDVRDE